MKPRRPARSDDHDALKTASAVIGAPVVSVLVGASLVCFLPVARDAAFAIGVASLFPMWTVLACVLPLAKSGRSALVFCLCLALPSFGALVLRSIGGSGAP